MKKKFIASGIYSKRMYYFKLAYLIFSNIPILVHLLFWPTLFTVIIIEFGTDTATRLPILNIINNLSYNTLAGCIFYLAVNHIPQEYKKVKLHLFINNKTTSILIQIDNLFKTLIEHYHFSQNFENITWEKRDDFFKQLSDNEIDKMTRSINTFNVINSQIESKSFNNWIEYWNWKVINIKKSVNGLAPYNEILSPKFLKYLTWTESQFDNMEYSINYFNNPNNNTLHLFKYNLQGLWLYKRKLSSILHRDFGVLSFRLHSFEFARDNNKT